MESLHGNTFWILPGIIITFIVMVAWTCLDNYIKYKQFKAKLIPGAKLMCIIKCIDDEFDPGIEFHIEIMKRSVNQVRIRYSDGSEITKDMFVLYAEPWVFEDQNMEQEKYSIKNQYKPIPYNNNIKYFKEMRENAGIFIHQPDTETLVKILDLINILNKCIKRSDWPTSKRAFYNIKSYMVIWLLLQNREDISHKITEVQNPPVNGTHKLAVIKLYVGEKEYEFHQPIVDDFKWITAVETEGIPVTPFHWDVKLPETPVSEIIDLWKQLLMTLADESWFIYDNIGMFEWWKIISNRYKNVDFKFPYGSPCPKLGIVLNGGPRINIGDNEIGRVGNLRVRFAEIMRENNVLYNFDLSLKQNG